MTDTGKNESAENCTGVAGRSDALVIKYDFIDAFLSLESTEHIYIAHGDGYHVDWQRFKEYSMEEMSPEMMRIWAIKLMTFSKQLTAMADQLGET